MTPPELLRLIYRHYPRALYTTAPAYDATDEHRRQVDAARRAVADYPRWSAMLDALRARFEVQDRSLHILAGGVDPAYSAHVEIPGRTLGFHVCLFAPYYGIHRMGFPGEEPAAEAIAHHIEVTYGYEPIPPEIGALVVPDVALDTRDLGQATIYECLLSTQWVWCSQPRP